MVNMTDPYASWAAAGKKVYQFEMQNLLEDGYKESGVSLRREECEYVPWSRVTAGKFCIQRLEENG